MNRTELTELIQNGENSGVEFKRDDIRPEKLAETMAALLNLDGGHILLGVEKDRVVSGLSREPEKAWERRRAMRKATCVACGAVLQPDRVRAQLAAQRGGADVIFDAKGRRI